MTQRQPRSMPSLGTMMHPEIGLAGSVTGTGQFRKNFVKVRRESAEEDALSHARLEDILLDGVPPSQSLSRCDSGLSQGSSVIDSPGGSCMGERRRRFTVNSSSTQSVEELLPATSGKTAAKGRFSIADGALLVGPVDRRLGSLVSRGRIGPNRKFAVKTRHVASEASALPPPSGDASSSALPPWLRSASAECVSGVRRRSATPTDCIPEEGSLEASPEEGLWHEGLSPQSGLGRLLLGAESGRPLLDRPA